MNVVKYHKGRKYDISYEIKKKNENSAIGTMKFLNRYVRDESQR